ncbi:MAG: FAD:protein FMN transferase [Ruminococcaceae bacterium]|nr:FAD:protein FMN transferase [Oscillospiraceae bacterium]
MKKIRYVLIALMIGCLIFCFWLISNKNNKYEKQEFIMDTTCSITLYGKECEAAGNAIFDEIRRIDSLMNMHDEKSEISRINRAKANEKIKVSNDTYYVLKTALEICRESDGAFDITIAPVTSLWDFKSGKAEIPSEESIKNALLCVGYYNIVLDGNNTVYKLKDESCIDLGAAAKGYAGDKALEVAKKYSLTGGIIDLGGNILCFGENPTGDNGKWKVGIQTPFKQTGTYEKIIEIDNKTVVTSGTYQRYFEKSGKIYHHIIDPETGYPSRQKYNSVTIVADSSLKADCLATAIFVMGEKGKNLAKKYNGDVYIE